MGKMKIIYWAIVLLIGLLSTGCTTYFGDRQGNPGFPYDEYYHGMRGAEHGRKNIR